MQVRFDSKRVLLRTGEITIQKLSNYTLSINGKIGSKIVKHICGGFS